MHAVVRSDELNKAGVGAFVDAAAVIPQDPFSTVILKVVLIINELRGNNSALVLHFQGRLRRQFPQCKDARATVDFSM